MKHITKLILACSLFIISVCSLNAETLSGGKDANLDIYIEPGEYWSHEFKIMGLFTVKAEPQIAVWLEDEEGKYLKTVYITAKYSSHGLFANKTRPEALPVWSAKHDAKEKQSIDAVSQGTGTVLKGSIDRTGNDKKQFLMLEINNSFDYNAAYNDNLSADQPDYSDTSGQPAMIYKADMKKEQNSGIFELKGHAHPAGKDGKIYSDLSKVTTAQQIIKTIAWKIR